MFQPSGPNLSRSRTVAWKKHSPKSSFLNSPGRVHESNQSGSIVWYEPSRFARMPLGGSFVILTPFWRMNAGKCLGRLGREPQPEVGVHAVGAELLADALEHGHPRDAQVAVLQARPRALVLRLRDGLLGDGALALAERDRDHALAAEAELVGANLKSSVIGSAPGVSTKMSGVAQFESS